jgi:hypothetical protein
MRDYLLVDQYAVEVEHRFLEGREWRSQTYRVRDDVLSLTGVAVTLSLDAIYDLVDF